MKKIVIISFLLSLVIGFNFLNSALSKDPVYKFHTEAEIARFQEGPTRAPIEPGEYFLPSSSCRGCHGYDSAGVANVNEDGNDVNLFDRWEATMMALSAKDPLWRAKVSQEILVNPAHSGDLQNKCTSCHAPMGHYTSKYHGNPLYSMSDLATDTLGQDGVSCGACHSIAPNVGFTFSGEIPYDTNHVEYGPFTAPYVGPMQLYEGLTPVYSPHMDDAKLCSSCHTLITQSVDLAGNYTGGYFIEQATFHEYKNSDYPGNNISCQTCHMPKVLDPIMIANGTTGLTARTPFNQHTFAGANFFMLNLMKNNKDSLGISASDVRFDTSIAATVDMLRNRSINLGVSIDNLTSDTAYFSVNIENKAGHKFPSGYPSRRTVVQFIVLDANLDTVFKSGMFNNQYRVIGEGANFEPHHDIIVQSNVPQIYEMVMGDVGSQFTSVLERGAILLKDNRIPPKGFTTSSPVYDTVTISNDAVADPDFNKISSVEGSGIDLVHFHVPLAGAVGSLKVITNIYYQSVPPKWLDEMFTLSSPDINRFKSMFLSSDQTPFLVATDTIPNILLTGITSLKSDAVNVWPTLTMDGKIYVTAEYGQLIRSVEVYGNDGKKYAQHLNTGYQQEMSIYLPSTSGIYYLRIQTGKKVFYKKVVKS
ncbi:MAG: cytochrome c family protein [Bacteroidota bacterium]|nr:cytochrome c family protein [Bacteroidota bacterium]